MAQREIMEKSLKEDSFSSHIHEVDLFAERVAETGEEKHTVPERYGLDRCALMMVNPYRLFFYWEISPDTRNRLGMEVESVLQLCVMEEEKRLSCAEVCGDIGSYYIAVSGTFSSLHAVLLWTDPQGTVRTVLRTKSIRSARGAEQMGEFWMDKNGNPLLEASRAKAVGSSFGPGSSYGLHVPKELP